MVESWVILIGSLCLILGIALGIEYMAQWLLMKWRYRR